MAFFEIDNYHIKDFRFANNPKTVLVMLTLAEKTFLTINIM